VAVRPQCATPADIARARPRAASLMIYFAVALLVVRAWRLRCCMFVERRSAKRRLAANVDLSRLSHSPWEFRRLFRCTGSVMPVPSRCGPAK